MPLVLMLLGVLFLRWFFSGGILEMAVKLLLAWLALHWMMANLDEFLFGPVVR